MKKKKKGSETPAGQVLISAYGFLSRRPHSQLELEKKLIKKGFCPDVIKDTIKKLCRQGYLNDEEISFNCARSLVQVRGWGRDKIFFYLLQKGVDRNIIDRVQREIWKEFSEEETARKVLKKRFTSCRRSPAQGKMASFLKSRGFSTDVVFKVLADSSEDIIE